MKSENELFAFWINNFSHRNLNQLIMKYHSYPKSTARTKNKHARVRSLDSLYSESLRLKALQDYSFRTCCWMTASCFRPSSSTPILWPWKPKVMTTEDTEAASEKRKGLSKVLIHCGILISSAFYHRLPQIWDKKNLALKLLTGWMSFKMNKSTSCTVSKKIIKIGSCHVILERNIGEFNNIWQILLIIKSSLKRNRSFSITP